MHQQYPIITENATADVILSTGRASNSPAAFESRHDLPFYESICAIYQTTVFYFDAPDWKMA